MVRLYRQVFVRLGGWSADVALDIFNGAICRPAPVDSDRLIVQEVDRVVEEPAGVRPRMDIGRRFTVEKVDVEAGAHQLLRVRLAEGAAPRPIPDRRSGPYVQVVEVGIGRLIVADVVLGQKLVQGQLQGILEGYGLLLDEKVLEVCLRQRHTAFGGVALDASSLKVPLIS